MLLSLTPAPCVCASRRPERGNAPRLWDQGATSRAQASCRAWAGRDRVSRSPPEPETFCKWSKPCDLLVRKLRVVRITRDHPLNFRLFIIRQRALCREFLRRHRLRSFRLAGRMEITEMASAPSGLKTTVIVISAHSPIATKRPLSVGPNAASEKKPVSRSAKSRPCLARFVSRLASSQTIFMNLCTRKCEQVSIIFVYGNNVDKPGDSHRRPSAGSNFPLVSAA